MCRIHELMKRFLFLLWLVLLASAACFATDDVEDDYYIVGWKNEWSALDKTYQLERQADGLTWEITLPAAGDNGWFKIAPASAYGKADFWDRLIYAPRDSCRELSGTMSWYSRGAWQLPNMEGVTSYRLKIVPSTMHFELEPCRETEETRFSGTLPVLYLNTSEQVTSKTAYVKGYYYIDALGLEGYSDLGSADEPLPLLIKGHGNWTWTGFDKKPYRLKLDQKAKPLGMRENKHFTLIANANDNMGYLRHTVGYELSRLMKLGYTPEQRPVEVVMNGQYIGLYMLTDKIRVGKNRVEVVEQEDRETDAEKMTGGWLLEIDNYDALSQVRLEEPDGSTLKVTCHSPEILSRAQWDYLCNLVKATDAAINNPDKNSTEWEQYIDMESLARYYVVQEVIDDGEAFHGSCFMHKDRGSDTKLVFGPVWDFGNAYNSHYEKFIYVNPPFDQFWIGEIAGFPRFQQQVREAWQTFLEDAYPHLEPFIDNFIAQIETAADNDGRRWPAYSQGNMTKRRDYFKLRLKKKVDFLRQQWGDLPAPIHCVTASDLTLDTWTTMDGRRLSTPPLRHGIYLRNRQKVVRE